MLTLTDINAMSPNATTTKWDITFIGLSKYGITENERKEFQNRVVNVELPDRDIQLIEVIHREFAFTQVQPSSQVYTFTLTAVENAEGVITKIAKKIENYISNKSNKKTSNKGFEMKIKRYNDFNFGSKNKPIFFDEFHLKSVRLSKFSAGSISSDPANFEVNFEFKADIVDYIKH